MSSRPRHGAPLGLATTVAVASGTSPSPTGPGDAPGRRTGGRRRPDRDAGLATLLLACLLAGLVMVACVVVAAVGRAADLDAKAQTAADAAAVAAVGAGGAPAAQAAAAREVARHNDAVVPEGAVVVEQPSVTVRVFLAPPDWQCWLASESCTPAARLRDCAAAVVEPGTGETPPACRSLPTAVARAEPAGGREPRVAVLVPTPP